MSHYCVRAAIVWRVYKQTSGGPERVPGLPDYWDGRQALISVAEMGRREGNPFAYLAIEVTIYV